MVTSRSCPHRCTFCSVHATFGTNYRRMPVARVLAEIKQRYAEGYRVIDFEDDNLTYYKDDMKALCRALIDEFPKRDVEFVAMNGISYLSLDSELLQLMRDAGFSRLNLALVTSDKHVREATKRPHTIAKYLEVVHTAIALGFQMTSYQILGLPGESLASMIDTLTFAARLPVLLGASPFYLTPNSPIAKSLGIETTAELRLKARLSAMAIETPEMTRDDLYTLFVSTRIVNFVKSLPCTPCGPDSLAQWIEQSEMLPPRTQLGLTLLDKLLRTRTLHAATRNGLMELPGFKHETFERIWTALDYVMTPENKRIQCEPH